MSTYPFTEREQEAVRQFGKAGFRYDSESKKELRFVCDRSNRLACFSRSNQTYSLNLNFGTPSDFDPVPGVTGTDLSSSSNLNGFDVGTTSHGATQKQGVRVFLSELTNIPAVLGAVK